MWLKPLRCQQRLLCWTWSPTTFLVSIWSDHQVVLCRLVECTMIWVWFSIEHISYCGTRPSFLTVVLTPPTEWGPHSATRELYFCCLGKHSQTETGFETNFLPTKGENLITSYCIVLMFRSAKIWWLVKEILVSWSIGCIYTFYGWWQSGIKLWTGMMDGCLILNKLVRRRVKLHQSDGNTAVFTVEMRAFLLGFSCPTPTLLLLALILLGPGEATHSELLSTKSVKWL